MDLQYPELIGFLTGLSLILVLIIATMISTSYTDQDHELQDLNESVQDLNTGFNFSEKKSECSSLNGTVVNYTYGANSSQTFVGCRM